MRSCALVAGLAVVGSALAQDASAGGAAGGDGLHPKVKLVTSLGDIVLELDAEKAPITVANFVQYVEEDFYDGLIFHRIVPDFMIQGGGFSPDLTEKEQGLRPSIKNEWQNGLKNVRGTIAMARTADPDSAKGQFFINVVDNGKLDQPISGGAGYAVFGKVVGGLDVVDKIKAVETAENPKLPMGKVVPKEPVVIKDVEMTSPFDKAKAAEAVEKAKADAIARVRENWPADVKTYIEGQEKELGKPATLTPDGIAFFTLTDGNGPVVNPTDKVKAHYTGWLVDGKKFDSSVDRGQPFPVDLARPRVIPGWIKTLKDMKVGEKRKIVLPPELAYGSRGAGADIPPNSYLVFDIELLEATPGK
jgi:cyclophilin family peptidyl-prolyl cis-trans isomerase